MNGPRPHKRPLLNTYLVIVILLYPLFLASCATLPPSPIQFDQEPTDDTIIMSTVQTCGTYDNGCLIRPEQVTSGVSCCPALP